ncbi:uncharacterized protein [Oryza sativa Japonica Group]
MGTMFRCDMYDIKPNFVSIGNLPRCPRQSGTSSRLRRTSFVTCLMRDLSKNNFMSSPAPGDGFPIVTSLTTLFMNRDQLTGTNHIEFSANGPFKYQVAYQNLGLLGDDREWYFAIADVASCALPYQLCLPVKI